MYIKINNKIVSSVDQQQNGNPCTHETRNTFNKKVAKYSMLGKSKKIQWGDRRRFRNI